MYYSLSPWPWPLTRAEQVVFGHGLSWYQTSIDQSLGYPSIVHGVLHGSRRERPDLGRLASRVKPCYLELPSIGLKIGTAG